MNILFYDIKALGHHAEYINHIVDYLVKDNSIKNTYYFVVQENFTKDFSEITNKALSHSNIHFLEVQIDDNSKLSVSNRFFRSINHFKVMDGYANKLKIDICYLLDMNVFQLAIGLNKISYKIKGILFMQFTNMTINSLKTGYFYLRRFFPLLLCMKNKNIDSVFLLNDVKSAIKLNKKFKKNNVFKQLPDPIPNIEINHFSDLKNEYKIKQDAKVFLHFGGLSGRKGVLEIVEAAELISERIQEKIVILIVGKTANPNFQTILQENINTANINTKVKLIWDNKYVSNEKMAKLFKLCDFVLIPYKNPEGSSGILGHALQAKKPVIGPSIGLLGELIDKYEMGYCLNEINAKEIAFAINKYETIVSNENLFNEFLESRRPRNFVEALLS